jgi:hypothetical protein
MHHTLNPRAAQYFSEQIVHRERWCSGWTCLICPFAQKANHLLVRGALRELQI